MLRGNGRKSLILGLEMLLLLLLFYNILVCSRGLKKRYRELGGAKKVGTPAVPCLVSEVLSPSQTPVFQNRGTWNKTLFFLIESTLNCVPIPNWTWNNWNTTWNNFAA